MIRGHLPTGLPPGTLLTFLLVSVLVPVSCESQDAVGKFAASSVAGLQRGTLVLRDMPASCQRSVQAQLPVDQFLFNDEMARSLRICTDHIHVTEVLAISSVLTAYFSALGELASSSASPSPAAQEAGRDAKAIQTAAPSGTAQPPGPSIQQAKGSVDQIAALLDDFATGRLRHKALKDALTKADPAVSELTQVLSRMVQEDYVNELLADERDKEANRFTRLAHSPDPKPAFGDLLTLNGQWVQISAHIDSRQAAAHSYIEALRQIRAGHATLARQFSLGKLKAKELDPALEPYASSLAELTTQIGMPF
ncbi:MAG: hypothetical protein JO270_06250 [Acidobacteriaceae bacterium]|nr:hypothetical protein [Acidobacteriaceae bacterium]MBV8572872.1 hypothetical protein [Acidobacteriaceae bacterium]